MSEPGFVSRFCAVWGSRYTRCTHYIHDPLLQLTVHKILDQDKIWRHREKNVYVTTWLVPTPLQLIKYHVTESDPAEQAARAGCTAMWPRLPIIYLRLKHLCNFVSEKRHTGVGFKLLLRGSKPLLGGPKPLHGQESDCYCNGPIWCCASTVIKLSISYGIICHTYFGPSILKNSPEKFVTF